MRQLELGCGDNPRVAKECTYYVGIDRSKSALILARKKLENYAAAFDAGAFSFNTCERNLGFDPLPFTDGDFDFVLGDQFLEHVPRIGWRMPDSAFMNPPWLEQFNPVIDLLNEVCRVTRPGGLVQFNVPKWNSEEMQQDPTHVNAVPPNFWIYWDPKDQWGIKASYGIRGSLALEETVDGGWYHIFKLRNIK